MTKRTEGEGEAPAEPPEPASKNWRALRKPSPFEHPDRGKPASGVRNVLNTPTIVFVSVGTKYRKPWLATRGYDELLVEAWRSATHWRVGRYVIMPDHAHFFAAPYEPDADFEKWMRYWRSQFTRRNPDRSNRFLQDSWHTRMRSVIVYEAKWEYVRENPVRHQLVERAEDWPYQGELTEINWIE